MKRIIVGISGASGAPYGVKLVERLASIDEVETHLVVTRAGEKTLHHESGKLLDDLKPLVSQYHPIGEIGANIASGSFLTDGMIVAPCSINTASAIAYGQASNLLIRAADVILKERRRLILMVRETPFHLGHLRTLTSLAEMGAIIAPPMPDFYNRPEGISDVVDQGVDRMLDLMGVSAPETKRWEGV